MIFSTVTGLFFLFHIGGSLASTPIGDNICNGGSVAFGNCAELKTAFPTAETGAYRLSVGCGDASCCKEVFCQMDLKGGGWTVFQRRFDGSEEFHRDWTAYENGFGSTDGEHWLGLSYLSTLLSGGGPWDLLLTVDEPNYPSCIRFQQFDGFSVGDAASKYVLGLGSWLDGNLEYASLLNDRLSDAENGNMFSTHDQDNDNSASNCAETYNAGWWFNDCHNGNVNGIYSPGCIGNSQGISIKSAGAERYAFAGSMLAFRPTGFPDETIPNKCNATQTDFHSTCTADPAGSWKKSRCGPWGHWEDWDSCPTTPGCGIASTRSRQRVHRYEDYSATWPNCRDSSDPAEIQTETGFCPEDCNPSARTGVYRVSAGCTSSACCRPVYCEMDDTIGGGGWTVFQRRFNGTVNFYRNWTEYEEGFGLTQGEHWMGLKHLYEFVKDGRSYELLLKVYEENYPSCLRYHRYKDFYIEDAAAKYRLSSVVSKDKNIPRLRDGCSKRMDTSLQTENGQRFSTFDQDNDIAPSHCASDTTSGWWMGACYTSNMNGIYKPGCTYGGRAISLYRGTCHEYGYAGSEVMFRPADVTFEKPFTNLCTQTDTGTCIPSSDLGADWKAKTCGHWLEWGDWSNCSLAPTCRRTRTRGRILALVPTAVPGCEDGTSPDYLDEEYEQCNQTCDKFCGIANKQLGKKIRMGSDIIQIIASTIDVVWCSQICLNDTKCRAFQVDVNTRTCVLSNSQTTSVDSTDPNIHFYFLN